MHVCTAVLIDEIKALKLTISTFSDLVIPIYELRPGFATAISLLT